VAKATTVTVTDGNTNQQIQNGGSIYNPASDSGPFFLVNVQGASAYIYLSVTFWYTDPSNRGFTYVDTFQLTSGTYNLSFPGLGGQNVVISWSDVCGEGAANMNFVDYGTNPAIADIQNTGAQYGYPWFWPLLLSAETLYNIQYATSNTNQNVPGMPIFGAPDGIGLTQLDGTTWYVAYNDYLSYKQNVKDGLGVLFSKKSAAYNWINQQVSQAQDEGGPAPPSFPMGGNCGTFGAAGARSLQDANWISYYNGGYLLHWRNTVGNTPGAWVTDSDLSYLTSVCQSNPLF
jgi:hypothetical protein